MSTISAGTTTGTALVSSGDTTGQLVLQTNGTTTAVTIGTNQVVTLAQPLPVASGGTGSTTGVNLASSVTGTLPVANGGTGATSLTANNVLLGNGTSAVQVVAPGSSGNVLTSNGTTWQSTAPAGGGSLIYLTAATAASSATVDLETGIGATYDNYIIYFNNVAPVTEGVNFRFQLKIGGTYNFITNGAAWNVYVGNPVQSYNTANGNLLGQGMSSDSTNAISGYLMFSSPTSTSIHKRALWFAQGTSGSGFTAASGAGVYTDSASALTGVRFLFSSGNISRGTFRLYGIKNS